MELDQLRRKGAVLMSDLTEEQVEAPHVQGVVSQPLDFSI